MLTYNALENYTELMVNAYNRSDADSFEYWYGKLSTDKVVSSDLTGIDYLTELGKVTDIERVSVQFELTEAQRKASKSGPHNRLGLPLTKDVIACYEAAEVDALARKDKTAANHWRELSTPVNVKVTRKPRKPVAKAAVKESPENSTEA